MQHIASRDSTDVPRRRLGFHYHAGDHQRLHVASRPTQSWNHAPERASRPFSADRDGFVLAEGSWMFLLEEIEHAKARNAHIYAELPATPQIAKPSTAYA